MTRWASCRPMQRSKTASLFDHLVGATVVFTSSQSAAVARYRFETQMPPLFLMHAATYERSLVAREISHSLRRLVVFACHQSIDRNGMHECSGTKAPRGFHHFSFADEVGEAEKHRCDVQCPPIILQFTS